MAHNVFGLCVRFRKQSRILIIKTNLKMSTKLKNKDLTSNDAKPVLVAGTFENYLIMVGIRSVEYTYEDKVLFENVEYFRRCQKAGLSAYKALLFLHDYINGDYDI